ncbi:2-aminoethylphosphonate ABC transporter substrate-binding protein [Stenotrophomonas sp. NPDC087984]
MASAALDTPAKAARPRAAAWAWALPPVGLLTLVFLYPLALVVQQSVRPDTGGTSVQPYADVFASEAFREALWTTVWLAAASTAGCLVLGFVLALIIAFVPFPGARAVSRFIDVFLSFPSFLITLALLFIYGSTGMANGLWTDVTGAGEGPFQFLTTPWGVLLAEITYFTPFVMRPLLAAFSQLDTAQLEAASSLGARAPRIILPEALPALAAGGSLVLVDYFGFVHHAKKVKRAPATWEDLLDGDYKNKLQYSTPGVAGDGTAVLIKAMHDFGGEKPAMDYLARLQKNNVGPAASTGKLAPKVDKGELLVANGDVQMNYAQSKSMPNLGIWFPARGGGKPTTFALPYAAGLVTKAPHTANGKKLLDYMLSRTAQNQVSEVGGGFAARKDIKATDANATALSKLMDGVEIFQPDWDDIQKNLPSYIDAWKSATDS